MSYETSTSIAMKEEVLASIYDKYHFWDRSLSLMKYQMNRAAFNGEWDIIIIMLRNIPFQYGTQEYLSVFSYANKILDVYQMDDILPINNIEIYPTSEYVATPSDIGHIEESLTLSGGTVPILDTNPVVIEHTYSLWDIHDNNQISRIIYDTREDPARRLAIAYASGEHINENIVLQL